MNAQNADVVEVEVFDENEVADLRDVQAATCAEKYKHTSSLKQGVAIKVIAPKSILKNWVTVFLVVATIVDIVLFGMYS